MVNDGGAWGREDGEFDDNTLLRDVAFNKHSHNFSPGGAGIVSPLAKGVNDVGTDGIQVKLVQGLPEEADVAKVIWKGRAATRGVDINDDSLMMKEIGDDPESWREMFRGGLQTAMEAFVIVFEVSGVSRTCTHQIVRSRRAGFHQQSQRAGSYVTESGRGANVRVPESIWRAMNGDDGKADGLADAWAMALYYSRKAYRLACEADISYQDARYILPEGTENYIMCEYTLREFLNVYAYRACSMFSWEITHVVRLMGEALRKQSPWLVGTAGDPKISCELTRGAIDQYADPDEESGEAFGAHACTFQGWERVEGQCGLPWARESNRTFKPKDMI